MFEIFWLTRDFKTEQNDFIEFYLSFQIQIISYRRSIDFQISFKVPNKFSEIVQLVHSDPTFRPSFDVDHVCIRPYLAEVMQACWNADANQRPEFKGQIRQKLKPLFKEIQKRNIMVC